VKALVLFLWAVLCNVAHGDASSIAGEWSVVEAEDAYVVYFKNNLDMPVCIQEPGHLLNLFVEAEGSNFFDENRNPPVRPIFPPEAVRVIPGTLIGTIVNKSLIQLLNEVEEGDTIRFAYHPHPAYGSGQDCAARLDSSFSRYFEFSSAAKLAK